jgi:hypothetical protein
MIIATPVFDLAALPNGHHLDIGHLFHGEAHTLTPKSTLAIATVWHVVGSEVRRVIDNHTAEVEPLNGCEHPINVLGEHPDLQPELGVVSARSDRNHRTKSMDATEQTLFSDDLHIRFDVSQHGRIIDRAHAARP